VKWLETGKQFEGRVESINYDTFGQEVSYNVIYDELVNQKIAKEMNVTLDRITVVESSLMETTNETYYWKENEDEQTSSFASLKRLDSNDSAVSSSACSTTSQVSTYPQYSTNESKGNISLITAALTSLEKNPVVQMICSVSID
jgi:hypothetical protein